MQSLQAFFQARLSYSIYFSFSLLLLVLGIPIAIKLWQRAKHQKAIPLCSIFFWTGNWIAGSNLLYAIQHLGQPFIFPRFGLHAFPAFLCKNLLLIGFYIFVAVVYLKAYGHYKRLSRLTILLHPDQDR